MTTKTRDFDAEIARIDRLRIIRKRIEWTFILLALVGFIGVCKWVMFVLMHAVHFFVWMWGTHGN